MKWPRTALVVLLLGSNAFWILRSYEDSISITYLGERLDSTVQNFEHAVALANLNLIGVSSGEAKQLIGTSDPGLDLREIDECLYAGDICIKTDENGIVTSVGRHR